MPPIFILHCIVGNYGYQNIAFIFSPTVDVVYALQFWWIIY